jgi:hypothetical protein
VRHSTYYRYNALSAKPGHAEVLDVRDITCGNYCSKYIFLQRTKVQMTQINDFSNDIMQLFVAYNEYVISVAKPPSPWIYLATCFVSHYDEIAQTANAD